MKHIVSTFVFILLLCCACRSTTDNATSLASHYNAYAKGFVLEDFGGYIRMDLYSPWNLSQRMGRYYLLRPGNALPDSLTEELQNDDTWSIPIPIKRLVTTSCTQVGFMDALCQTHTIVGACNAEMVYTPLPKACISLGEALNPSYERIIRSQPDAIMLSTYAEGDPVQQQLLKFSQTIVYNNEWMESHPLGRAEWIRVVGALYDQLPMADSIFAQAREMYESRKAQVLQYLSTHTQRSIMSGQDFRGTWYVPSGDTYMGTFFADAGARYYYADDKRGKSIPLSTEQVIREFGETDVWVGCNADSREALQLLDNKHQWFNAWKNDEVYNFNRQRTTQGGNNFWEQGVVYPHLVLEDLIEILYPELLEHDLNYCVKLK